MGRMNMFSNFLVSILAPLVLLSSPFLVVVVVKAQNTTSQSISNVFKYESNLWPSRNLKGNSTLDLETFDLALNEVSTLLCDLGITVTVFDGESSSQVYQETAGNVYYGFSGYLNHSDRLESGWSGDTPMAIYSNSKILGVMTFLAAVVDPGLGYIDEPIYRIFPDLLSANDTAGMATPRMLMSHSSGLAKYNRNDPEGDPYYSCIYNETTTLEDCLSEYLFDNATLAATPGTIAQYANEPFDVLAAIVVRKTGASSYGEVMEQYLTGPLGMNDTSIDCDVTQSTSDKPHVAWGVCSTAHDMAKLVQVLGNNGVVPTTGEALLSPYSMSQIFSRGTGVATNADGTLLGGGGFPFSRCYSTLRSPATAQPSSIAGYGLGTMFMPGTKGQWFTHAGSKGGYWAVAPGRFSAYFGWQDDAAYPAYYVIASLVDTLDQSGTFYVSKMDQEEDEWEEMETCGGDLYIDWFAMMGIDSILNITAFSCGRRRELKSDWMDDLEEVMQEL